MKSIGQVNYEARNNILNRYDEIATPVRIWYEQGALAVLLHSLDMLHKASVSPDTAAIRLRRGESLEAICDPAYEALMNAPPLSTPLTEDEKKAVETWKASGKAPEKCHDHKPEPEEDPGRRTMGPEADRREAAKALVRATPEPDLRYPDPNEAKARSGS